MPNVQSFSVACLKTEQNRDYRGFLQLQFRNVTGKVLTRSEIQLASLFQLGESSEVGRFLASPQYQTSLSSTCLSLNFSCVQSNAIFFMHHRASSVCCYNATLKTTK